MNRKKTWIPRGYISLSRTGSHALVCVEGPPGTKNYYIADIHETLSVLTKKQGFVKLLGRRG